MLASKLYITHAILFGRPVSYCDGRGYPKWALPSRLAPVLASTDPRGTRALRAGSSAGRAVEPNFEGVWGLDVRLAGVGGVARFSGVQVAVVVYFFSSDRFERPHEPHGLAG